MPPPDCHNQYKEEWHKHQRLYFEDLSICPVEPGQIKEKTGERQIENRDRWDETEERNQPREVPGKVGGQQNRKSCRHHQPITNIVIVAALLLSQHPNSETT